MLSEEVEQAVRNIQLLDDNIRRRINDSLLIPQKMCQKPELKFQAAS